MIQIGNAIVSFDVFEKHFLCDITTCKGACCIEGDSGAPVSKEEAMQIESFYKEFEQYLSIEHRNEIQKQGFSVIDTDGDLVTPLFNKRECVYTFTDENGITKCAIEKAFFDKKIDFRKPVSCHLFPIRITSYSDFDAVNYQQIEICKPGIVCGQKQKLPLFQFLKEPLIRKYGEEWYNELEIAADYLNDRNSYSSFSK